jgi:hypothetical protein
VPPELEVRAERWTVDDLDFLEQLSVVADIEVRLGEAGRAHRIRQVAGSQLSTGMRTARLSRCSGSCWDRSGNRVEPRGGRPPSQGR